MPPSKEERGWRGSLSQPSGSPTGREHGAEPLKANSHFLPRHRLSTYITRIPVDSPEAATTTSTTNSNLRPKRTLRVFPFAITAHALFRPSRHHKYSVDPLEPCLFSTGVCVSPYRLVDGTVAAAATKWAGYINFLFVLARAGLADG